MTIRQLLEKLKDNGVDIDLNGDNLDIYYDGELDKVFLNEIINNKQEIISFLKERSVDGENLHGIPKAPLLSSYLLSSSQKRIWVLSQIEEANKAYNDPGFFWFEGDLNVEALEMSFRALINRHDSLRTIFEQDESGMVSQTVRSAQDISFHIICDDLRSEVDPDVKAKNIIEEEIFIPFDLSTDLPVRARLLQIHDRKYIFTYVLHHIISDGWSMKLFIKELLSLYNSYSQGKESSLFPLRIQYKDYAMWEQEQLRDGSLKVHKQYWLNQLNGEIPILTLPESTLRPPVKTYNGAKATKILSKEQSDGIKQLCRKLDSTLFMGLLGLVNTLLYRYTAQSDIIIGTAIAGRDHLELEDQIGYYINTLPLRTRFNGTDTFNDLINNVKEVTLEAYDHQAYPFDELINDLGLKFDLSRNALFDVSVVLQNTNILSLIPDAQDLHGLKVGVYEEVNAVSAKFDLSFTFEEVGTELHTSLVYNCDIYSQTFANRLLAHLEHLLQSLILFPDLPLNELDYLSELEKLQLNTFNGVEYDYPRTQTIIDLFEEQVQKTPDNIAIVYDEKELTYNELNERANQLADYLRKTYSIKGDDLVGIKLEERQQIIITILGILKSGAAYLPIDPDFPAARINQIVEDSKCKTVMDDEELERFYAERSRYSKSNLASIIQSHNLAYVIYTSGSTGQPKGVMIEHHSLVNLSVWHQQTFGVTASDRSSLFVRASFDASVMELFPYLISGSRLYVIPKEIHLDFDLLSEFCNKNELTICAFPPPILEHFIGYENKSLRYLITGGDKLRKYLPKNYKISNQYGVTEGTVVTTNGILDFNEPKTKPSIGKPVYNTQVYIVDENQKLVPVGIPGELCIGGVGLARGYLNNPGLTLEKFVENPFKANEKMYKTGDLCRWMEDGNIEYLERKDDQVKIRGFRIELGEIEKALQKFEGVNNSVVIANEEAGEKVLVAYVASIPDLNMQALRVHLKVLLPDFMMPKYIIRLDILPATNNGKIDKKSLPAPDGTGMSTAAPYVAPANETDQKLVKIWEEILGKEGIGLKHDFFELGGHSLKATKLSGKIHKEFGVKLSLNELFANTKLEEQAFLIDAAKLQDNPQDAEPTEVYTF